MTVNLDDNHDAIYHNKYVNYNIIDLYLNVVRIQTMQKFFYGRSTSESPSKASEAVPEVVQMRSSSVSRADQLPVEATEELKEMNFVDHLKFSSSSLKDTQATLADALEAMALKERVIREQESEIQSLKSQLKECRTRIGSSILTKNNSVSSMRISLDGYGDATPESAYPDLSATTFRPKRMAISAEPRRGDDALPCAPTPISKSDRLVFISDLYWSM